MEKAFKQAAKTRVPCVIHVLTKKGYGYHQAEDRPETFHGTPPFFIETGDRIAVPSKPSWGHVMADTLAQMCEKDARIVALTAAMKLGTGLDHFAERYPDRLIDVGIAEEHAATMAAGLAAGGMRPYFAVYSSFFQRCYDQMIHDVCMQHLPVVFLLDRSGIGGEDGQTHHGLFDFAATLPVPGITVLAPCCSRELISMLEWTQKQDGPCVVRYAKSGDELSGIDFPEQFTAGKWDIITDITETMLFAVGSMVPRALKVRDILAEKGIPVSVVNCSTVKPLDTVFLDSLNGGVSVFTLEEHMITGGFGLYLTEYCLEHQLPSPKKCFGVADHFIQHGNHELLMKDAELTEEQIAASICQIMKEEQLTWLTR